MAKKICEYFDKYVQVTGDPEVRVSKLQIRSSCYLVGNCIFFLLWHSLFNFPMVIELSSILLFFVFVKTFLGDLDLVEKCALHV